jgi:hypothetical protein
MILLSLGEAHSRTTGQKWGGHLNPAFQPDSFSSQSIRSAFAEKHETATLRARSPLRRVLHLIWEIVWPYEIVWNSKQQPEAQQPGGLKWRKLAKKAQRV